MIWRKAGAGEIKSGGLQVLGGGEEEGEGDGVLGLGGFCCAFRFFSGFERYWMFLWCWRKEVVGTGLGVWGFVLCLVRACFGFCFGVFRVCLNVFFGRCFFCEEGRRW